MWNKLPVYRSMFPDNTNFCSCLSFQFKYNENDDKETLNFFNTILDWSYIHWEIGSVASNLMKNQIFYIYNKKDVQRSLFS